VFYLNNYLENGLFAKPLIPTSLVEVLSKSISVFIFIVWVCLWTWSIHRKSCVSS